MAYTPAGKLTTLTQPDGGITSFTYNAAGSLTAITFPDGKTKSFLYENISFPGNLTGIIDENGDRYATWSYDAQGRAVSSQHAGGADLTTLSYNSGNTVVTDPLGTVRTSPLSTTLSVVQGTGKSQPGGSGCGPASSALTYDANGNTASRNDFNGSKICYGYDLSRNLETKRVEGLTSGAVCSTVLTTPPSPTTANPVRTVSTQWHSYWRLPTKQSQPLKLTTWVYNGDTVSGNIVTCAPAGATVPSITGGTQPIGVLCQKIEQATTDATGSAGFGATATGTPRTWSYTYNQYGQVLTADGPRTDVSDLSTWTYYAANDASLGKRGNVATLTDALGHVTQITSYDGNGRPLTIIDPNGVTTTLTYDPRGRMTSKSTAGESTTYTYDGVGQLTKLTLPDGAYLAYTYDAAHRQTGITDRLGNQILYTLDAMGNRTQEQVKDPANQLAQTRSRAFDALNRLYQDIGAQSQTTTYAYDANGNLTGVTDPLSHVTANGYDALNRLIQITDPANGQTTMAYNGQDRVTQVTDPRSLATGYTLDGLGNLTAQSSPDSGNSSATFDAAGNALTRTDAKGQVAATQYDALNRVTQITWSDGRKHVYTWDQGANGVGRLTQIAEYPDGVTLGNTLQYSYDALGRITADTRSVNGTAYTTAYQYSSGDLSQVTYPSGKQVAYSRDLQGRISQVQVTDPANGNQVTTVASAIQYQPFGGIKGWTNGAGQSYTRAVDQDGRIAAYTLGSQTWQVGYDTASRITYQTDAANAANTANYGYDALDRLTSALLPNTNLGYGYDANGNRLTQTVGAGTTSYSVSGSSNRLNGIASTPPRSYSYDANGSQTADGTNSFSYDARGRLTQATTPVGTVSYQINALGQRTRKTVPPGGGGGSDLVFIYDLSGHLIVEADAATGKAVKEYLYLNDTPLAVMQ